MKNYYVDFSFPLHIFLNFVKSIAVFLFSIFIIVNENSYSQMCSAPPISPGSHVSVDAPSFWWQRPSWGPSCTGVMAGATTLCPINYQFPPIPFYSGSMSDTCVLLSNSQWGGYFGLNGIYCWGTRVQGGGLTWSNGGSPITRLPAALDIAPLSSPINGETGTSIAPRFYWNAVSGANSYTLKVYLEACCINVIYESSTSATALTIPAGILSGYYRYYWRVKAYGPAGEGPISDPYYFTTGESQPPNLLFPLNNSNGLQLNPLFDWEDIIPSLKYRIQLSNDQNFTNLLVDDSNLSVSEFQLPLGILTYNTTYYWKAAAKNSNGWGPFSLSWNFKTHYFPDPVTLSYPLNNSIEIPTILNFKWFKAAETSSGTVYGKNKIIRNIQELINNSDEPDEINRYWFELATDTVLMTGLLRDTLVSDTFKTVGGLANATSYYWRVKANNVLGWGQFSSWWKFNTVIGPPQAPVLVSPQNVSFQQYLNLPFKWNKAVEITSKQSTGLLSINAYWFELAEDTILFTNVIRDTVLTDTIKYVNLSAESKQYFWRVKTKNSAGWSSFSPWWRFISVPQNYKWEVAAAEIGNMLTGLSFADPMNGWISQDQGSGYSFIHKSTDGGSTWNIINSEMGMFANDIKFANLNDGVIASRGFNMYNFPYWITNNGGLNWSSALYINYFSCNMKSVDYTPEGIWAVGIFRTFANPEIDRSTIMIGGTEQLLPHSIPLNKVKGGKNNAWIVGAQGLIYRSLTQLYAGENVNLTGISFNDDNTGYACGENKLFKSTTNGASWFRIYPLSDAANYSDLYFANKDTGWVACTYSGEGVILYTTNGGNSWALHYKGQYAGSEFTFVENKYGWLLCGNSVIRTTNISGQVMLPPVLQLPANGAVAQSLTPLLDWQPALNAVKYRVQLSADSLFSSFVADDSSITATEYNVLPGLLQIYTNYFWRVASANSEIWSEFSSPYKFRTFGIPNNVILNYPSNNASGISTSPTFNWFTASPTKKINNQPVSKTGNILNDAAGVNNIGNYWFELTSDTVNLTGLVTDSLLTDTSKSITGLTFNTSYYWRVKAKNEAGWGAFSSWWKFTTTNGIPVLLAPVNNKTEEFVTPYIDWSDITDAVKYRLQVSAFGNFSVLWIDDSNITVSEFNVSPGILAYNSLYYWRVKSKNSAGWSNYQVSPFRFFTQIIPPPPVPVLVTPLNNSTGNPPAPLLDWNDASGAVKYRLQVSPAADFSSLLVNDSFITSSSYQVAEGLLEIGTVYYWKVSAKNNNSWSKFSSAWNFKTSGIPRQVILNFPPDNSSDLPLNILFSWFKTNETLYGKLTLNKNSEINRTKYIKSGKENVINGISNVITGYWFELSTDTNTISSLIDSLLTDSLKQVTGLNEQTKYYWRVKAKNENGWGLFSNWWSFTTTNNLPPAAPVLISPVYNAAEQPVTPLLVWNAINGATGYRLQVSAFGNFSTLWIDDSNITSSTYRIKNGVIAYNSLYYWRVKAKNASGWGSYQASPFRFFTMIIPPPSIPVLNVPSNGSTGNSLTPLLDWNDQSGITKYRLQLALDTGFTNKIIDDSTIVLSQFNVASGVLQANTIYYWRVNAKNNMYWSGFSGGFSFKTISTPLNVILLYPENNSIELPLNITFTWRVAAESNLFSKGPSENFTKVNPRIFSEVSDNISSYWFELVRDTVNMTGLLLDSLLTDTLKPVSSLSSNTVYYWRVKAKNEVGWGAFSVWWKFTTISGLPPAAPVLIYPANRAENIPVTPLLDWSDVPGAQKYLVQVSAYSNFSVLWINDSSSLTSQYQVQNGVLAYNSGYYWRVKAKNDAGWGNYQTSPFRFFTLIYPPQSPPVLLLPANNSVNNILTPLLDWNDISGTLFFRVQVSQNINFSSIVIDDSTLIISQYSVSAGVLNYNTQYYWRVSVKTASGWSSFSSPWNFTTIPALVAPQLLSPVNKDTGIVVTPLFVWNSVNTAASYRLQVSAFSNFSVLWIDKYISDTIYQTPPGVLAYNSRYFWRVKSLRAGDSSGYSGFYYFFTKIFPYGADYHEAAGTLKIDLADYIVFNSKGLYGIEICPDTLFNSDVFKVNENEDKSVLIPLVTLNSYSTYFWRITLNGKNIDKRINVFVTYEIEKPVLSPLRSNIIPDRFALYQNYPNPFNPNCNIRIDIPAVNGDKSIHLKLTVYDLLGREVDIIYNSNISPGIYEFKWNGLKYPSGIYLYRMESSYFSDVKKMVLLK